MFAQVLLTATIWVCMYAARLSEMRTRGIDPQSVKTAREAAGVLEDVAAADNFRNLFEVPVLFFAVGCLLAMTDHVTDLQLIMAWAFVSLRAVHSLIHVTYNRVVHRFTAYALSTLCVFAMWLLLARDLWRSS